jgi:hypothetical protein
VAEWFMLQTFNLGSQGQRGFDPHWVHKNGSIGCWNTQGSVKPPLRHDGSSPSTSTIGESFFLFFLKNMNGSVEKSKYGYDGKFGLNQQSVKLSPSAVKVRILPYPQNARLV